jgi:hypothetical protein
MKREGKLRKHAKRRMKVKQNTEVKRLNENQTGEKIRGKKGKGMQGEGVNNICG